MLNFGKRILMFLAVNALILLTLSFTLNLLGVGAYFNAKGINYQSLMLF